MALSITTRRGKKERLAARLCWLNWGSVDWIHISQLLNLLGISQVWNSVSSDLITLLLSSWHIMEMGQLQLLLGGQLLLGILSPQTGHVEIYYFWGERHSRQQRVPVLTLKSVHVILWYCPYLVDNPILAFPNSHLRLRTWQSCSVARKHHKKLAGSFIIWCCV